MLRLRCASIARSTDVLTFVVLSRSYAKVTDFLRGHLVLASAEHLEAVLGQLQAMHRRERDAVRIVGLRNRLGAEQAVLGYRDALVLLDLQGHVAELRLHLEPLFRAGPGGRDAYETFGRWC